MAAVPKFKGHCEVPRRTTAYYKSRMVTQASEPSEEGTGGGETGSGATISIKPTEWKTTLELLIVKSHIRAPGWQVF